MKIQIIRSLATVAVTGGLVIGGTATAYAGDSDHDSSSSDSSLSLPLEIGGLSLGSSSESSSSSSGSHTEADGDGSSTQQDSSEQHAENDTGLEVDPSRIDLLGALSNHDVSPQSKTEGSASAPIELGGVKVHQEQSGSSSEQSHSTQTDGDGSHQEHSSSQESHDSKAGLDTGAVSVNPQAGISSQDDESSSHTGGEAAAPLDVEGVTGWFSWSGSTQDESGSTSTDGDESTSQSHSSSDQHATDGAFGGGGLQVDPQGSLGQHQGDDASATSLTGSAPYWFEGFWGEVSSTQQSDSTDTESATDGDESATSTESQSSHDDTTLAGHGGQAQGAPSLGLHGEQSDDESSAAGGLDAPFAYEGLHGLVEQHATDHGHTSDTVTDGDESVMDEDSSTDESHQVQELDLDGIIGHPAGWFTVDGES